MVLNRKVIVLLETNPIEFDLTKRYLKDIEQYGYKLEIWSCEKIIFPSVSVERKALDRNEWNLILIENERCLCKEIKRNRNALYFDMLGASVNSKKVRVKLALYHCEYVWFFTNPLLCASYERSSSKQKKEKTRVDLTKLVQIGILSIFKLAVKKIYLEICTRTISRNPPRLCVLSTKKNNRCIPRELYRSKVLYTHSWDYENYLRQNDELEIKGDYIAFIDSAMTHHPEWKLSGLENPYNTAEKIDRYYSDMIEVFVKVEEKYKMPVIIAAHPRANYQGNEYGERMILQNKTRELIKGSSLVLSGLSTSLNYVVLYDKPIIYVKDNFYILQEEDYLITEKYFERECYNIENCKKEKIDKYIISSKDEKYMKYKNDYIIDECTCETMTFWEKVFEELHNFENEEL